ncbi:MAG: flagellar M-ring protein FliF [Proteobacteria bacterium]|nr:flagellar M-ring protein FliF [Pseudomonadota bacterium]
MAATGIDTTAPVGPDNLTDRLRNALARLNNQQKIILMVAIAAVIAILVASNSWLKQSDYRILFSNISERDGGAIIAALEQLNIPYRFSESGGAILIPSAKVNETRLRLATQGLPKGGGVGFELMENQKFGISQFAEQVNYQRGLEGELSRTIQSIRAVQAARVHLAIPKPTVFVREELKPSASVLINLYPGRLLDPSQIAGIQNLVAASVPNLAVSGVTLIDQSGAMLSQLKSKLMEAGLDPTQIKYVQEIEASVIKRINDILLPIVGQDNVRVQIAADVDFSQNEQTAETHRPNVTPPDISIRSQQTTESASATPSAQGIPGALTNQPPVPATAPLTQPAVPGAGPAAAPGQPPLPGQLNAAGVQAPIASVAQPISTRKDSTVNYEVDKTIRHTKQSIGTIKRLSAAVVVNHRKDAKGLAKPLSDTELKQINELVKEAMGFSKERGDTVSVANAPFTAIDKTGLEVPLWKDPENIALIKELLKYAGIAAIIAFLLFKVIIPLTKAMLPPPPVVESPALGGGVDIVAGDEGEQQDLPPSAAEELARKLDEARDLAQKDPKVVSNIIKDWMGANG